MNRRSFVPTLLLLLAPPRAASADNTGSAIPWEKFDEEDGIAVYRKEIPRSPIVALRGEGVVNASIVRVTSVLIDTKRGPEWVDRLAKTKLLRRAERDGAGRVAPRRDTLSCPIEIS